MVSFRFLCRRPLLRIRIQKPAQELEDVTSSLHILERLDDQRWPRDWIALGRCSCRGGRLNCLHILASSIWCCGSENVALWRKDGLTIWVLGNQIVGQRPEEVHQPAQIF